MWIISLFIWVGVLFSVSSAFSSEYNCYSKIEKDVKGLKVRKSLGGIVGMGWNDITNEETLPILSISYNNCRTVQDADFLIPDNVVAIPIKISHIVESAESFDTFNNFKNSIGGSIEGHAGGGISKLSVSGSLSVETKIGKEHIERNGRTGFSNKLEYHAYNLIANENNGFDETFTNRLKEVAEAIKGRNLLLAQYEAESIIGDYGTHVTNRAVAGARMTLFGFTTTSNQSEKNSFSLKMSAKFDAKFMGASAGGKVSADTENSDAHGSQSSSSHTYIFTHGGADIKNLLNNPGNKMSVDSIVGLKRSGIPIHAVIHKGSLEGIYDPITIGIVQDLIFNATEEFYRHNTIPGCTDSTKQNYFIKANVEDGTCKEESCVTTFINPRRTDNRKPRERCDVVKDGICVIHPRPARPRRPSSGLPFPLDFIPSLPPLPFLSGTPNPVVNVQTDPSATKYENPLCKAPIMGGIIQECEYISSYSKAHSNLTNGNQCAEYTHHNQLTKDYSCPSGFEKTFAGSFYATFKHRFDKVKNESCDSTKCHSTTKVHPIIDKIKVTAYWCFKNNTIPEVPSGIASLGVLHGTIQAAMGMFQEGSKQTAEFCRWYRRSARRQPEVEDICKRKSRESHKAVKIYSKLGYTGEGLVFGGIFENDNIFSENRRCAAGFQEYPFFHNLKICLALPTDFTVEKSVEFGGMISCHDAVQECPKGLSKYLATTIKSCPYYYCASIAKQASFTALPQLKKPPYVDRDLAMSKTRYSFQHEIEQLEEDENDEEIDDIQ